MSDAEYVPGVCNIAAAEIAARKRVGWMGLILVIAVLILCLCLDVNRVWRLLVLFPSAMSSIGFLQARERFCVAFGLKHVFNVGPEVGKTESVTQAEFRAQDKRKAWEIIGYALMIGTIFTLALYLL